MARTLENAKLLDSPVTDVMGAPYPVVDSMLPLERLTALLTRESPAVLVRQGGRLVGIVTRYDVLRHVAGLG
jgi:cystathionine beta-synthase